MAGGGDSRAGSFAASAAPDWPVTDRGVSLIPFTLPPGPRPRQQRATSPKRPASLARRHVLPPTGGRHSPHPRPAKSVTNVTRVNALEGEDSGDAWEG